MNDPNTTAIQKPDLACVVSKVEDLSTLPQVLNKIMDIISDPDAGAKDLQEALNCDPALTSKILKVANSSYYGLREKILNVKRAIVFLGFSAIKNIAIAASVCDMFESQEKIHNYSRSALWEHSVMVAVCSKAISQRAGLKDIGEDIFTAGIMHDIGIIIEDQYLHDHFTQILKNPHLKELGFLGTEQAVLGFDHAVIGEQVGLRWKIPEEISRVIACHHRPQNAHKNSRQMTSIVYLADVICNSRKIGFSIDSKISKEDFNFALNMINFRLDDMKVLIEELPVELEKAKELFVL